MEFACEVFCPCFDHIIPDLFVGRAFPGSQNDLADLLKGVGNRSSESTIQIY